MKRVSRLAPVLLLASISVHALPQAKADLDLDQTVTQTIQGEHDCTKPEVQFAFDAQSTGLPNSEPLPPTHCRAVTLTWLPSAKIVQLTGVQHRDVFVCLTILRVDETSPIRFIQVARGMVQAKNDENDQSNKGVFNELLRTAEYRPKADQMIDLGALYLYMVGDPPDETPKKLREVMAIDDMTGSVSAKRERTIVTLHQRTSFPSNSAHGEWKLEFLNQKGRLQLISVMPDQVGAE